MAIDALEDLGEVLQGADGTLDELVAHHIAQDSTGDALAGMTALAAMLWHLAPQTAGVPVDEAVALMRTSMLATSGQLAPRPNRADRRAAKHRKGHR